MNMHVLGDEAEVEEHEEQYSCSVVQIAGTRSDQRAWP